MIRIIKPIVAGKETALQKIAMAEGAIEVYEGEIYLHTQEGTHLWDKDHMLVMDGNEWHYAKMVWFIKYAMLLEFTPIAILVAYIVVTAGVATFMQLGPLQLIILKKAEWIIVAVYLVMAVVLITGIGRWSDKKIRKAYV